MTYIAKHSYLSEAQMAHRVAARAGFEDHKQFQHAAAPHLPAEADLVSLAAAPYDQGSTSSCTANAICGAIHIVETDKSFNPSRLFVYFEERVAEGQQPNALQDSGADPLDGLRALCNKGVCAESDWPFDPAKVDVAPSSDCYAKAAQHKAHQIGFVARPGMGPLMTLNNIRQSIVNKIPVLIGIAVYESLESEAVATSGVAPMPNVHTEQLLGYHEVLIIGYSDTRKAVLVRNSWGASWGLNGNFWLPYAYVTTPSLCSQFLCISKE